MKQSELLAEVERLIEEAVEEQRVTDKGWLIQSVLASHGNPEGDSADFFSLCAYEHVSDTVRSALSRYRPKPEGEETKDQWVLPGFERLQKAYLVDRDGKSKVVPIVKMTTEEVAAKAEEYRRIGAGCQEHADELDRYLQQRTGRGA